MIHLKNQQNQSGLKMNLEDYVRESISEIKSDIKDIKKDLKDIYQFKWKIIGIASTISFLASFIGQYFSRPSLAKDLPIKQVLENENVMGHQKKNGELKFFSHHNEHSDD